MSYQHDPYAPQDVYAQQQQLAKGDSYGQPGAYAPQQPYGQPGAYPPQQAYGQPAYGQPGVYSPQQAYGQPGAYAPQQPYGQPGAYAPQQPYGQPGAYAPQQPYGYPVAQQQAAPSYIKVRGNSWANSALYSGIFSIILALITFFSQLGYAGLITGTFAIYRGSVALVRANRLPGNPGRVQAIAAIALGVLAWVLVVVSLVTRSATF